MPSYGRLITCNRKIGGNSLLAPLNELKIQMFPLPSHQGPNELTTGTGSSTRSENIFTTNMWGNSDCIISSNF